MLEGFIMSGTKMSKKLNISFVCRAGPRCAGSWKSFLLLSSIVFGPLVQPH